MCIQTLVAVAGLASGQLEDDDMVEALVKQVSGALVGQVVADLVGQRHLLKHTQHQAWFNCQT